MSTRAQRFVMAAVTAMLFYAPASHAATGQPAQVIYVDATAVGTGDGSSWSDAFNHLQDALADANEAARPAEIRVAQGIYRPDQGAGATPDDREATFALFNHLTLRGGYAGAAGSDPDAWDPNRYTTVLSGGPNAYRTSVSDMLDNIRTVVTASLVDATVVVEGLTITGACSQGMLIDQGSPTIRRCRFIANGCKGRGLRVSGSPNIVDCHFEGNRDGGAMGHEGTLTMTDCSFVANREWGIQAATLVLNRCTFLRNRLEAVDCRDGTLTDCDFTENGGIAVRSSRTLDLVRCSFVNNAGGVDARGTVMARSSVFNGNSPAPTFRGTGHVTVLDCRFDNNSADTYGRSWGLFSADGDVFTAKRCVFQGNLIGGFMPMPRRGSVVCSRARVTELSGCLFAGNSGRGRNPGAVLVEGRVMRLFNCTFADNRGQPSSFAHRTDTGLITQVKHCILWDGPASFSLPSSEGGDVSVTYCNVEDGYPGSGNVSVDPEFVARGAWVDPNDPSVALGREAVEAVWTPGDYHLKSQAGHWDPDRERWVLDDSTSPCVDLGDPNGPLGTEPFPNGGYVNLGAYGGTDQASRSYFGEPVCETRIAGDINGDCQIDDLDMEIMLSHWLMEDIGSSNMPPTLRIVSPEDGAVLDSAQPLILRFEASDPDGQVLVIRHYAVLPGERPRVSAGWLEHPTAAGWVRDYGLSPLFGSGVYVLHAEALDDDGALTVADPITVTLER